MTEHDTRKKSCPYATAPHFAIQYPTPKRSGTIASSWRGPVRRRNCSPGSTRCCERRAGWRWADRSSTATVIDPAAAAADPGREGYAQGRRHAGRVETGTPRSISTATAAGSSSAAANASPRQAMATSARSRSRSRCSATRITSASTASMACCAATPSPTRRRMTAVGTVFDRGNTASDVWADTAYRSAANLALLERRGLRPQFQRKKPRGKKMPAHIARGNATRVRTLKFWCRAR